MIYLIGGPPRCGKSTLTRLIQKRNNIPGISTDILIHMLKKAAPELGVTDQVPIEEKSERFFPFLEQFIKLAAFDERGYVIEGDAFLPKEVKRLEGKFEIKALFLGFSKITLREIMDNNGGNNWMESCSQEKQESIVKHILEESKRIKEECEKYGYEYVDMTGKFEERLEKAYDLLVLNS